MINNKCELYSLLKEVIDAYECGDEIVISHGANLEQEKKLKPCPFCGGKARAYETAGQWSLVSCDECSAEVPGYTKAEAIEAWNRRA